MRRIAICEDSSAYAVALGKFLTRDPELLVVGSFRTAEELIEVLPELEPDLVTMDLELPGMDGIDAIESIMANRPRPILVVSSHAGKGSRRTAEALAAGAMDAVHKQRVGLAHPDDIWATALRSRIKRLASLRLKPPAAAGPATPTMPSSDLERPARAVAIGASTGGPPALRSVLAALPADYPLPVLVVQHIASTFTEGLVSWLDGQVTLPVRMAREGAAAGPGVWFSPGDAHLLLEPSMRFSLDYETESGPHRPSVDTLLSSLAEAAGEEAVGVVLTGMGRDGSAGVEALRAAGGTVVAQDEESSAVFGMPRAAVEAGANVVMSLNEIGPALSALRVAAARP